MLFNSRFYYPVFTILFLDFGLTVAQFAVLNAVWAATIVLAEVPSGALADIFGRRRLIVSAASIMMLEIGMISFVPTDSPSLVFGVFLVNRVFSGLAEAAASGADEAIAYDSLAEKGLSDQWGFVLEVLMRFQSIGFIVVMSLGAAIYDHRLLEAVGRFSGLQITLSREITMRFPLYLTLMLALGAWIVAVKMKDPPSTGSGSGKGSQGIRLAIRLILEAGLWICRTPFALAVILFGMLFDGIIRMIVTLSSQYYRMIDLPESLFGLIGSFMALLGLVIPKAAGKIAEKGGPPKALWITALLAVTGLSAMNLFQPYYGLVPALVTFSAMYFTGFFVSFYLNQTTPSTQRATVLSFKGLAFNISYGLLGVLYALVLKTGRQGLDTGNAENTVFVNTFFWFPLAFAVGFVCLLLIYVLRLRGKG